MSLHKWARGSGFEAQASSLNLACWNVSKTLKRFQNQGQVQGPRSCRAANQINYIESTLIVRSKWSSQRNTPSCEFYILFRLRSRTEKKKKKAEPVQHRYTKAGSVQQVMNHYGVFRIVFENFAIQIDKVASLLMKLFDFSGRIQSRHCNRTCNSISTLRCNTLRILRIF